MSEKKTPDQERAIEHDRKRAEARVKAWSKILLDPRRTRNEDDVDPELAHKEVDRVHDAAHIRSTEAELDAIPGRDEDDHDE